MLWGGSQYIQCVKYASMVVAVVALLAGCSGKQDAVVKSHNKMAAAEQQYVAAYMVALQNENFGGLHVATAGYLQGVQNIDMSGCPDDYIQAMKGLENSLSQILGYLSGANNINNVDPTKFEALQDARLDATRNLNNVAESHGIEITH